MKLRDKIFTSTLCALLLCSCKSGYNVAFEQPITEDKAADIPCAVDTSPIDSNATAKTRSTLDLLANLSCNAENDGFIAGQSLGNGNEINEDGENSYETLIQELTNTIGKTPAMISIDYEYEQQVDSAELTLEANTKLTEHFNAGGLVMVSWSPLNPWTLVGSAAEPSNNQNSLAFSDDVDLTKLIDAQTDEGDEWFKRLDEVASALKNLEASGVTVLFRPFPEMNSNAVWWGTKAAPATSTAKHEDFIKLWEHTVEYFRDTKKLNNLLWVYSPLTSDDITAKEKADWAYPEKAFVDVVAGAELDDDLTITDYAVLSSLGHPLGMAKYGPQSPSEKQTFDNESYISTLKNNYPNVGFWISWHNDEVDAESRDFFTIIDQNNAQGMMEEQDTLSLEELIERNLAISN